MIKYFVTGAETNLCRASIKHHGMFGVIESPFYPQNYANNISCLWGVRAPPNHIVDITMREFILEGGIKVAKKKGNTENEVQLVALLNVILCCMAFWTPQNFVKSFEMCANG